VPPHAPPPDPRAARVPTPARVGETGVGDAGAADPERGAARAWTILEVLKWTTSRFAERGLPSPRLAAHAFGLARIALYAQFDRPLQPPELAALRALVKRRQAGEPVAYITGRKEFWSLDLMVDSRVLIPRPDTETAVELVLDLLRPARAAAVEPEAAPAAADHAAEGAGTPEGYAVVPAETAHDVVAHVAPAVRIADIGTGSGAIALALKKELPQAEVIAIDVSPEALAVARANAAKLGLGIEFQQGNLAGPLAGGAPLDLIVANLPYIPRAEIAALAPEVRNEPRLALDGGVDGLDLVRALVTQARSLLRPGGHLVLEIGQGQADATATLCRNAGYATVGTRRDLDGIERVVHAQTVHAQTPGAA
jgi:release factor glutamine methyltransferase